MDHLNRIVDINPAARRIFATAEARATGREAENFFQGWHALARICLSPGAVPADLTQAVDGGVRHYEASCLPLAGRAGQSAAKC